MDTNDPHRYDDMLDLPRPVSHRYAPMPIADRAAQFAPFAALTGYHAAIDETGRYTEHFDVPDELRQASLNEQLVHLQSALPDDPQIEVVCFVPDDTKDGGQWRTFTGKVHTLDTQKQMLTLTDGTQIDFFRMADIRIVQP